MPGKTIKIRSTEGGEFDCYLAVPNADGPVPAVVLACAVHGVDADIRQIADEFAGHGVIAAAPDLFWRTVPGPLSHDDERCQPRSHRQYAASFRKFFAACWNQNAEISRRATY